MMISLLGAEESLIPFELMERLEDFQFENRIRSRSQLVKLALESYFKR